jgi:hypothetical protein
MIGDTLGDTLARQTACCGPRTQPLAAAQLSILNSPQRDMPRFRLSRPLSAFRFFVATAMRACGPRGSLALANNGPSSFTNECREKIAEIHFVIQLQSE